MLPLIEAYWYYLVIALFIGLAVAWLLFSKTRRTHVKSDRRDVLDEGAAPAARNEALIASGQPSPTPPADSAPPTQPATDGDDLTQIKGLGTKIASQLNAMGVTKIAQIAAWDDAEIDRIDGKMGRFEGRIRRDQWVEQARMLEAGDKASFDARFGNS